MKKKSQLEESDAIIARARKLGIERQPVHEERTMAQIMTDEASLAGKATEPLKILDGKINEAREQERFFNVRLMRIEKDNETWIIINGTERRLPLNKEIRVNVCSLAKFLDRSSEDGINKIHYVQEEKYVNILKALITIDAEAAQKVCECLATSLYINMKTFILLCNHQRSVQSRIACALQKARLLQNGSHGWGRTRMTSEYDEDSQYTFDQLAQVLSRVTKK